MVFTQKEVNLSFLFAHPAQLVHHLEIQACVWLTGASLVLNNQAVLSISIL
jgi:hypothetical protein